MPDFTLARDEILAQVDSVWSGTGHPMAWPDVDTKGEIPPSTAIPWARTTITHTTGQQTALANHDGRRRFTHTGFVTIQVFSPTGTGITTGYSLAQSVVAGLQGVTTLNRVWFRNVRMNEVGIDGHWHQINVIADFEYDQFNPVVAPATGGGGGVGQPITLDPIT